MRICAWHPCRVILYTVPEWACAVYMAVWTFLLFLLLLILLLHLSWALTQCGYAQETFFNATEKDCASYKP